LQLSAELRVSKSVLAHIIEPLETAAAKKLEEWLPKLPYPDRSGQHANTAFALGLMLDSGVITSAMYAAARDFQAAFTIASFDNLPTVNLMLMARPAPGKHRVEDLSDTQVAARERVARALDALGGHGSPAGSCVWHVVGMQTSIREWATRRGWGGRPVRQESAQGILVAALGVLAKHYGIRDRGQRRSA
jgi:hypothetical protein